MKRDKEWWGRLTAAERRELVFCERILQSTGAFTGVFADASRNEFQQVRDALIAKANGERE